MISDFILTKKYTLAVLNMNSARMHMCSYIMSVCARACAGLVAWDIC